MTKQEAVDLVSGIHATFVYGLCLRDAITHDELAAKIDGKQYAFERDSVAEVAIDLSSLAAILRDKQQGDVVRANMAILLRHALVRMTHEIVFMYAEGSGQLPKFQAQPWYQFSRVLRNLLSHKDSTILAQWPDKLTARGVTSVSWNGVTISKSQIGQEVALEPADMLGIHETLASYLRDNLT